MTLSEIIYRGLAYGLIAGVAGITAALTLVAAWATINLSADIWNFITGVNRGDKRRGSGP